MAMLEVKDLSVYYGVIQALKGISFEVEEGDVIALIGANGAGKTTTLHALTGLIPVKSGSIVFEGKEITKVPGYKLVSMGIAHVPEGRRVFARERTGRKARRPLKGSISAFRGLKRGRISLRERSPAVSSRCWPWGAPSCPTPGCLSWMSPPWDFLPCM